jgi:hypothetical protein
MTYVIEQQSPMGSFMRLVNERYMEIRKLKLVSTKSGRELLVDEYGAIEGMVVDYIVDSEGQPKDPPITDRRYL